MSLRFDRRLRLPLRALAALAIVLSVAFVARPSSRVIAAPDKTFCDARPQLCTETQDPWNYEGHYTGHDEPSLLFYSTTPGSGNSDLYHLTVPQDPPTPPKEDGTGGTWNFQLRPAFWFGMALCDDQSAPNPGATCTPNSDHNIFSSTDPQSPRYFGNTPGTAFMEMQFYPPGWFAGPSCYATGNQWCAALTIDSLSSNSNTGQLNNADCLNNAGQEYVNFAFITKSGNSQGPADPLDQNAATFTPGADTFNMSPGDQLTVNLHDTAAGFQVVINDLTSGVTGSMTASVANGFGHPLFQPNATSCSDAPYAFHPMYSTSQPTTRVLWAAHSYNVAYSDEIGHFEYCNATTTSFPFRCTSAGVNDPSGLDRDDRGCPTGPLAVNGQPFTGCDQFGITESDFDGPEYQHNWPGSSPNPTTDASLHAAPVTITSPLFTGPANSGLQNYSQAAFENDLPRIEGADTSPNNSCQRHISNPSDPNPGQGCIDPPNGASFYPMFLTATVNGSCVWEEGDVNVPNVTNTFGGSPSAEYGGLLALSYPAAGNTITQRYNDFHRTLSNNPCPATGSKG